MYESNNEVIEFTSWYYRQPDNAGNGEDCVEMFRPAVGWKDRPCTNKNRFLCETTRF